MYNKNLYVIKIYIIKNPYIYISICLRNPVFRVKKITGRKILKGLIIRGFGEEFELIFTGVKKSILQIAADCVNLL